MRNKFTNVIKNHDFIKFKNKKEQFTKYRANRLTQKLIH